MSHDLRVECPTCHNEVVDQNYTYNYQPVFALAGMNSLTTLAGLTGVEALPIVNAVITGLLEAGEDVVNETVRGKGDWGDYAHLMPRLRELRDALELNPHGRVEIT